MTYQDVERADVLRPYCKAMGVVNTKALPKGSAEEPDDVEIYCGMIGFNNIKGRVASVWSEPKPNPKGTPFVDPSTLDSHMRYTEEELTDFYNYDTNLALRIIAEDEGKPFTRLLVKPAGFNEWLSQDGTVSVSSWVSEKKSNCELDVNEIGRKMLKKALFKNVASGSPSSSSRLRNGFRRTLANKATPYPRHFIRP
ncbi:hypothetical protein FRC05_005654, partial [Tulasnella sp. 425]